MAKRKNPQQFAASQFADLRARLEKHEQGLVKQCLDALGGKDFGAACRLRDTAQLLVTTRLILDDDGTLATAHRLAELSGEPQSVPHLGECGLSD